MTRTERLTAASLERIEDTEWGLAGGCAVAGTPGIATALTHGVIAAAFTVSAAGLAFESLRRLYDAGQAITEISFATTYNEATARKIGEYASLRQDAPYWLQRSGESVAAQLWVEGTNWADTADIEFLSRRIAEEMRVANIRATLSSLLHDSRDWHDSSQAFLSEAMQRLMGTVPDSAYAGVETAAQVMPRVWNTLMEEYDLPPGTLRGMNTGFPRLNRATLGLRPGQLTLITADTGVGKSMLSGNIAVTLAAEAKEVLIFSLEMEKEELMERYLYAAAKVSLSSFYHRRFSRAEQQRLTAARDSLLLENLAFRSAAGQTIDQIVATAQSHRLRRGGLDLMVVDYAQLVEGKGQGRNKEQNREREVAAVSRALKATAQNLGCHAIVLAQVNDAGQARESRSLKHDADFHLHLRRATGDETLGATGFDGDGMEVEMKRLICRVEKARGTGGEGMECCLLQVPGTTRLIEEIIRED